MSFLYLPLPCYGSNKPSTEPNKIFKKIRFMAKLNEKIKEFRLSVKQSFEGVALLLDVPVDTYKRLEEDWIPPDDLLERLCTLFSWNYQDTKRLASQSGNPVAAAPMSRSNGSESFGEMLSEARLRVNQNPEAMAMFLDLSVEGYLELESGKVPADALLRRICSLFEWNYVQIRQRLINRATPRMLAPKPMALKEFQRKQPPSTKPKWEAPSVIQESLASLLQKGRIGFGQSPEAIALLLNVPVEFYEQLESGKIPDSTLLKKIASLFHWNYNELQMLVNNENIKHFQPAVTKLVSPSDDSQYQLTEIFASIQGAWNQLPSEKQQALLSQLELLRDAVTGGKS